MLQLCSVFNLLLFTQRSYGSSCYIDWRIWPQGYYSFSWRTAELWHSRSMAQCSCNQTSSLLGRTTSHNNSTGDFSRLSLPAAQEVKRSKKETILTVFFFNRLICCFSFQAVYAGQFYLQVHSFPVPLVGKQDTWKVTDSSCWFPYQKGRLALRRSCLSYPTPVKWSFLIPALLPVKAIYQNSWDYVKEGRIIFLLFHILQKPRTSSQTIFGEQ